MNLIEKNKKTMDRLFATNKENNSLRESLVRKFGEGKVSEFMKLVEDGNVDWRKLQSKLTEADSASAFPAFLRAGASNIMINAYKATEVTYTEWATVTPSSKDEELYPINQGLSFPKEIGRQELYPEVGMAGMDLKLKNKKFGTMFACEYELNADDQTGSVQHQSALMGQYLALIMEVWAYGKLASFANMKYIDMSIPTSETKPSNEANWPWSTALVGGGRTRPDAFGAMIQGNITNAMVALMAQKNLQGIKMLVRPDKILVSPQQSYDISVLMNSAYTPSGAATGTATGGAFAINPIKGLLTPVVSRFMFKNDGTVDGTSKAWIVLDSSVPWAVAQMRETPVVLQEAQNSGRSFDSDVIRFKGRLRGNFDILDSRFAFMGSDGSV